MNDEYKAGLKQIKEDLFSNPATALMSHERIEAIAKDIQMGRLESFIWLPSQQHYRYK